MQPALELPDEESSEVAASASGSRFENRAWNGIIAR
jgi:hypothetical protein